MMMMIIHRENKNKIEKMNEIKFCLSHIVPITRRTQCSIQFCKRNELELISLYLPYSEPPHSPGWGGVIEILIPQTMDDNSVDSNKKYEGEVYIDMLTKFGM